MTQQEIAALAGQVLCTAVGHPRTVGVEPGAPIPPEVFDANVDDVVADIERHGVAGVCWFPSRPEGDPPDRVAEVVDRLQRAAAVPLLVATDQEGGRVARMRDGFFVAPSARSYAGDAAAVRRDAERTARELRTVGLNAVFAPDADVDSNPDNPVIADRSYSADPDVVVDCVTAALDGFAAGGVAGCVKHFPGHGDTAVDSHVGLPVIGRSRVDWEALEAVPFRAAVGAGVPMVMTGHLVLPEFDALPATFSHRLLTGVLRQQWGFDGVVVSDSLQMAGARQGRSDAEVVVDALAAGVDLLLLPPSVGGAVDALVAAVTSGRITEERLREAAGRVRRLKARLGLVSAD